MPASIFFIGKVVISGVLIAAISSLAKTFPKWAALLTALPLMTFLSLIWIYVETKDLALLANYTKDVLIWILPSFLFLIAAIYLFRAKVPFLITMGISTVALFIGVLVFEKLHLLK
ncbi:MAG: hypothetical protein A3G32_07225 [Deltaproteobacteria bacterium RIFCSPLOWO2_12_FULL_40_28]|nr:MAG: hypothetical protein A3C45_07270 [Deltaproteobacteria bacterium RIFCSPHIGHO2_02_FULL_40_28]OGQ19253.1 MAG: hypothetical protein A3E27_04545 [Deltaproteobacteria bacterium RIFCSPHIGHO2_12_FULL_40_32]OGQ40524.1 MAG: hypothetical protein A3I69_00525 [Deltaproteobacteria bacterium RIFCSPLOWO2_02_FULL_40_36]OGQ53759.1 MAG: hypothetical protein A3G32_07225 [Deltaproteobacteria bacterium RIFCSPLOWO2_12_FULL_40_28]OGX39425.1 MAG: hypothetical protein A2984_03230 [Omnitrophica WOR_2 bacterium RI